MIPAVGRALSATVARMGIRYYAYAFDADRTEEALADPRSFISSDPLADAWGLEPHAALSVATFEPRTPERDLLYLDKAWRELQLLTGPRTGRPARPSYRMFEGAVTPSFDGYGWEPWVRALAPAEVAVVADDLVLLTPLETRRRLRRRAVPEADVDYAEHYLGAARSFMAGLARDGRGMAYLIG